MWAANYWSTNYWASNYWQGGTGVGVAPTIVAVEADEVYMNDLERQVLAKIGEDPDAADVFDSDNIDQIRQSLSDAVQEITMLTGGVERQYYLPVRSGVAWYRFNLRNGTLGWITDVFMVNQKRRLEQTDLIRLPAYDPQWMRTTANPRSYIQLGQELIGLYPKPSGADDVAQITVVEIPAPYRSETDRVRLRAEYRYAAVHYAVAEYWASRGDARTALDEANLYLSALRLRQQYRLDTGAIRQAQTRHEPYPMETA